MANFKPGDIVTITGQSPILSHGFATGDIVEVFSVEGIYNRCKYPDTEDNDYHQWVTDDCLCEPFEIKVKKAAELYDEHEHGSIDGDTK